MATTSSNLIARKKSTDAKGFQNSSSSRVLGRRRSVGSGVADASRKRIGRTVSRNRSSTGKDLARAAAVADLGALEREVFSFERLGLRDEQAAPAPPNELPIISIGDSVVCLARDERLIGEMKRQKTLKRIQLAEAFSKDHYKYSLFAGEDPVDEGVPQHLELTPTDHVQIARASIQQSKLGIVGDSALSDGSVGAFSEGGPNESGSKLDKQKSRRYDSEDSTILVYGDRSPIVIPKLDFSVLPNFRKPRMYNQKVAKGHLKKYHGGGKNKAGGNKGVIGFLNLKFWH